MTITVDEIRLRRHVEAGQVAHASVKAAASRLREAQIAQAEAEREYRRHAENPHTSGERLEALHSAVDAARTAVVEAQTRHATALGENSNAQRLARRIQDFSVARGLKL